MNRFVIALAAASLMSCAAAKRLSQGKITADDIKTATNAVKAVQSLTEEVRPDQEYYVGRSVATNILAKQEYKYLDKEAIARGELAGITRYVNHVGLVVSAAAMDMPRKSGDRPAPVAGWHFTVIQDDAVNAFAAPGGFVFVTTGAVKLAKSEDELACVLAHEVAHVLRGHALGNIKKSRFAGVSSDLLQAAGTATLTPEQVNQLNGLLEGLIEDTLDALFVKGYSRDTEFEADRLGVEIASKAGYDPGAMNRFLTSLGKQQDTGKGGFFATHPAASERMQKIEGAIAGKTVNVPKVRVDRFEAAIAKLK
jgi:beta-barrel assembly-enhancing protease